jgi:cinnamyl-alcohol dehydrogenase
MIPGHEIAGEVTEVGKNVSKFKAGDRVGVGCMVNSCRSCESCDKGFENHCPGMILTYNSVDVDGTVTYGGYSSMVVVHERFVVRFPDAMPLDKGAPLLCAGITVYSPMKYHGLNVPGLHLGVLGLGGLGHVAVKFGKAFGMKVTVISSSPGKKEEALGRLGADAFIVSKDADEMKVGGPAGSGYFPCPVQKKEELEGSCLFCFGDVFAGCDEHHGWHHKHGVCKHPPDPSLRAAQAQRQDDHGRPPREAHRDSSLRSSCQ